MNRINILLPDGTRELRFPSTGITEGDVLYYDGDRYRVTGVSEVGGRDTATVEPVPDDLDGLVSVDKGAIHVLPSDEA